MQDLRQIEQDILARGRVDSDHLEKLHQRLYARGKVGREEADFLVGLHKSLQHPNPGFEQLFYNAIKDHILADGRIYGEEVTWLRGIMLRGGKITDEERKFLHELKGEAAQMSHEFETFFDEALKLPQERHTSR
jgi:hypothetical protein